MLIGAPSNRHLDSPCSFLWMFQLDNTELNSGLQRGIP